MFKGFLRSVTLPVKLTWNPQLASPRGAPWKINHSELSIGIRDSKNERLPILVCLSRCSKAPPILAGEALVDRTVFVSCYGTVWHMTRESRVLPGVASPAAVGGFELCRGVYRAYSI